MQQYRCQGCAIGLQGLRDACRVLSRLMQTDIFLLECADLCYIRLVTRTLDRATYATVPEAPG